MISKIAGNDLKKNIKTRFWWMKLTVAIVLSNILFFMLFSSDESPRPDSMVPEGHVEIQIRAELLTPFHTGKKVLLLQRNARKYVEAMLEASPQEHEGRFTVLVKESKAQALLTYEGWEIVPFLKTLNFGPVPRGAAHEIHY